MKRHFGSRTASISVVALTALFLFFSFFPAQAAPPPVFSPGAVLIDGNTGQILFERNSRTHYFPASTTKILTAIIAIERGRLDDQVMISEKAANVEGSSAYLEAGEVLTLEQLLYGLMLPSGNDAATAIAEHIGGSVEGFAALMNQKARALGALDSNFVTPSGLHDPNHYTSSRDLGLILRYALGNPVFARIASTKEQSLPGRGPRDFVNHNRLLWSYPYATGGKTGYTPEAGHTLAVSAERNGRRLVAVIMNSDKVSVYRDAISLFDFGFDSFENGLILREGTELASVELDNGVAGRVPAVTAGSVTLVVGKPAAAGSNEAVFAHEIEKRIELPGAVKAPVSAGDRLGTVQLIFRGRQLASVDLVAGQSVAALSAAQRFFNQIGVLTAKSAAISDSLEFSWWWAAGFYAVWRTGVGFRRYRRKIRRRRLNSRRSPPEYVPYHRIIQRDYGD